MGAIRTATDISHYSTTQRDPTVIYAHGISPATALQTRGNMKLDSARGFCSNQGLFPLCH